MTSVRITAAETERLQSIVDSGQEATVILAPGDYVVAPLHVYSPITLVGEAGPQDTVLLGSGGQLLNVYDGREVVLRGLTLRGGTADGGGAAEVSNDVKLTLEHCIVEGNRASQFRGGGLHVYGNAELTLLRSVLRGNRCERGGAIAVGDDARLSVDRCVIAGNRATLGGGIWASERAGLTIRSTTFVENVAEHAEGGASLFVTGSRSSGPQARLVNCVVADGRPLVVNAERAGRIEVLHCLLSADVFGHGVVDGGDNLLSAAELIAGDGVWSLRAGAVGSGAADVSQIDADAVDFLGRALVQSGRADLGAIAPE